MSVCVTDDERNQVEVEEYRARSPSIITSSMYRDSFLITVCCLSVLSLHSSRFFLDPLLVISMVKRIGTLHVAPTTFNIAPMST